MFGWVKRVFGRKPAEKKRVWVAWGDFPPVDLPDLPDDIFDILSAQRRVEADIRAVAGIPSLTGVVGKSIAQAAIDADREEYNRRHIQNANYPTPPAVEYDHGRTSGHDHRSHDSWSSSSGSPHHSHDSGGSYHSHDSGSSSSYDSGSSSGADSGGSSDSGGGGGGSD